jgi:uncharacterized Tic20 family protein
MGFINENKEPMKLVSHLSIFMNFFPFAGLIAVFLIWTFSKNENSEVEEEAKKAINWQITMLILGLLFLILTFLSFGLLGFILAPLYTIISLLFPTLAAIRTYSGNNYQYPFTLKAIN